MHSHVDRCLGAARDPLLVISQGGVVIASNARAQSLLGRGGRELARAPIEAVLRCPGASGARRDYARQMRVELVSARHGARAWHATGREIPVDVMLCPDPEHRAVVAVVTAADAGQPEAWSGRGVLPPGAALRRIRRNLDHLDHLLQELLDRASAKGPGYQEHAPAGRRLREPD
jgi:hypothetical protein